MIREDKFLISKRPYAVDLSSLTVKAMPPNSVNGRVSHRVDIRAAWFRRRGGELIAVLGTLWDYQTPPPVNIQEALARHDDGRYGGAWVARWDGDSYVSEWPLHPDVIEEHMALLRPMLDNYPDIPPGYDGWWRFQTDKERFGR